MKKLTIPVILAATIMVAGMFAFVPVQDASTVHTSGQVVAGSVSDNSIDNDAMADDAIDTAELADDAVGSDELDDTDGAEAVTTAHLRDDAVTNLKMADNAIDTAELADDAVGSAEVDGSNSDTGAVHFAAATGATAAVQSPTFSPAVSSQGIAICTVVGTEDNSGPSDDATLTLTRDAGGGTIQGTAVLEVHAIGQNEHFSATGSWTITGETTANAQYTCTLGGTNLADADVSTHTITILWFPE